MGNNRQTHTASGDTDENSSVLLIRGVR